MKGIGQNPRHLLTLLGMIVLVAALALATGCGKDKPVPETDPEAAAGQQEAEPETMAEPVTPEQPAQAVPAPDYAAMEPAEYGVEDIFFAFDQYELDDVAMGSLARNARLFKDHPEVVILIEGHCDERGTIEYNLALGEKRAKAVKEYLVSLGVSADRLRVTSYGESRPFALGSSEASWAKNRRAHFARP